MENIIEFITSLCIPIVIAACLVVGYCIKHISWLDKVANEYIPLILAVLGAVLGCIAMQQITLVSVVGGAVSGLAAVGLHQVFKQWVERKESNE
jgi:prepilin signal peptidase PulO-like enzyme (type II secretory pathway)